MHNMVLQIYNVDKRIQEDNLQHLALFSEYGRMALLPQQKEEHGKEQQQPGKKVEEGESQTQKAGEASAAAGADTTAEESQKVCLFIVFILPCSYECLAAPGPKSSQFVSDDYRKMILSESPAPHRTEQQKRPLFPRPVPLCAS